MIQRPDQFHTSDGRHSPLVGSLLVAVLHLLVPTGPAAGMVQVGSAEFVTSTTPPEKSIALYVGRNLTTDGSVLLGGFGHEPSSHWYEITPRRRFPPGTLIEVGITPEARIPGHRLRIPQVQETARFITTNYSEFAGFPPPLTNGGLNEYGVAARDVWSPSREELVALTPRPQTGLNYSDLSRIVMERATSAREAAELVGRLIEEHGYATYGGNSHLFADATEGWVLIEFAGGQGLWAAERLGPDDVRVLYPGWIGDFPPDHADRSGFMGSKNLVSFAVEQGWWSPEEDEPFNLHRVYGRTFPSDPSVGDPQRLFRHPPTLEEEIREMAPIAPEDMMALVRDPRWSNDGSGYGQVAHLVPGPHPELRTLWMSITGAVASPFVPVQVGVRDIPPEYKQHRYMTKDADDEFLDPAFAPLEATRSAFRVHKRLLYHVCEQPRRFLVPVTAELELFEARLLQEHPLLLSRAGALFAEGAADSARALLTHQTNRWLMAGLTLGEALLSEVEAATRREYGIRLPEVPVVEGATWRPESGPMTRRPGSTYHRCWREGLATYPRRHGSYSTQASTERVETLLETGAVPVPTPGPPWRLLVLVAGAGGLAAGWLVGRIR